jgi:hypothetical protein
MSKLSELEKELAELFKSSLDAEKLFYLWIQVGCVFRFKVATYSRRMLPPIPLAATNSG